MRRILAALATFACLGLAPMAYGADAYPTKPVRLVVPFAPGGGSDFIGRLVAQKLAERLGQPVIVENRPGAGGTVGAELAIKSPPDGYTLLLMTITNAIGMSLYPNLKYHPVRDLTPVAIFGNTGAVLLVNNDLPVKSAQDLVALGKSKPGELTFASTGVGTPGHLNGELFSRLAGLKAVHVPYRVVGQAVTDFVAGRIAFWIAPIPTMLQNVRQGQLKPLAVAGGQRSADLPGIPTVQETGIGNFDASTTYALFAPPGTPRDIVDWVHSQIGRALEDETVQQKLRAAGVTPKIGAPEEVTKMLEWRIPEWAEVIKSAGIKIN